MGNQTFERKEIKYLLTTEEYTGLMSRIGKRITPDLYGQSTICNIYYDTQSYDLIRTSLDKPEYKEKLRLRSYGIPAKDSIVYLEIKKKYKGIVYKRRISLPLSQAESYLSNQAVPQKQDQIFNEIDYFIRFYKPHPVMYIAYDRMAYQAYEQSQLRITFDTAIRSRENDLYLESGDYGELLFEPNICLMEIKAPGAIPLWLTDALSSLNIFPVSFSKYGKIYSKHPYQITLR